MQRAKGKIQRISRRLDFDSIRERFGSISCGSFGAAFLTVVRRKYIYSSSNYPWHSLICRWEKRRRAAAVQDAARDKMIPEIREASWSAPVLWRFARRRNVREISA